MSEKSDKAKAEYARKKKLRQKKHMEMIIPDKDIDKTYIQFNEDGGLNHYRKDINGTYWYLNKSRNMWMVDTKKMNYLKRQSTSAIMEQGEDDFKKDRGMPTSGKHPDAISRIHKYMKRKDF